MGDNENQKTLSIINFFSDIPILPMSFLLPLYCLDLGFSPIETAGLSAAVSLALLLSKLIIGNLSDKIGRKKLLCFGLLIEAISYGFLAYAQCAVPIYIAQILRGISISLISVSMYALMFDNREFSGR